ncbi:MAG: dephospho-CoA kinase [Candidatus Limnocylindrales bacterium]
MNDAGVPARPGRQATVRIGLTGPIGCGKSTVAAWLAGWGATVIDADEIAREVSELPEVRQAILQRFGPDVGRPDGRLDRAALAKLVFADPAKLRELESLTHPGVRERIEAEVDGAEASGAPAVVIEAIKLVEGGLAGTCDEVWLITCDPAEQLARLEGRGMAAADAAQRIGAQGDLVGRLRPAASRVISTGGSSQEAQARVDEAYRAALEGRGTAA